MGETEYTTENCKKKKSSGRRDVLTGDSEVVAEEGSAEGADDAGEDEVAGDLALV